MHVLNEIYYLYTYQVNHLIFFMDYLYDRGILERD